MGSSASHSGDPVVGKLVDGRYRVTGVIARGGMATVYRADDTRLDRVVALKVMHKSFAEDPGFVSRFRREARAAAKLNDPHVVRVFDQGAEAGLVWLAMDYVPGYALREVVRVHAPLDPDRALGAVEQILSGLIAAHQAGFVHRDIKPENVLMTPEGTMKITDFGLARAMIDDDPSAATKGVLIGTVAYLAPEQVETGHADERSDIYATGIVLYELLTGSVPFQGPTPLSVAYRHVNDRVPAPSTTVAGISPEVDALVLRATARHPEDRFPSAAAFLQAAQAVDVAYDGTPAATPAATTDSSGGDSGGDSADGSPDGSGDGSAAGRRIDGALGVPSENPSDPADDWERIAAVATTAFPADSPTPNAGGHPDTSVLRDEGDVEPALGPDVDPTSAFTPGIASTDLSAAYPTTALFQGSATTAMQPETSARRGATPLTPVTRKPPASVSDGQESAAESIKSISRFGRTKLVLFLIVLVALMAAGGWWLGMRHNAGQQAGVAAISSAAGHPTTALGDPGSALDNLPSNAEGGPGLSQISVRLEAS